MPAAKRRRFPGGLLILAVVGALIIVSGGGFGTYYLLRDGGVPEGPQLPPAKIADNVFKATPNAPADGLHQVFGDVAAVGNTVVAVGSEYGGSVGRARFLVSTDGGSTWRVAPVKVPGGKHLNGNAPNKVVGSSGGWLALGGPPDSRTVWTSKNGLSWTQLSPQSDAFIPRDEVVEVVRTADGYVAVGYQAAGGDEEQDLPVVWLSTDGGSWQRVGPDKLALAADDGTVGQLGFVTARDATVVMSGEVTDGDGATTDAVWRSTDAGRTWEPVDVLRPDKAGSRIRGLSANRLGFFALRQSETGDRHGIALASADGAAWEAVGTIAPAGVEIVDFQRLAAGDQGITALATTRDDHSVVYRSNDGRSWQGPADLGWNKYRAISSLAPTPVGVFVVGTRLDSDQDFYLALAQTSGRATEIDLPEVDSAVHQERTVRAVVAANGQTVALGSTNGDAAAWVSAEGTAWTRAGGDSLNGYGQQRLIGAAHGDAGWLAVGTDESNALVATSADAASWNKVKDKVFETADGELRTVATAHGPEGYVVVGNEDPEDSPVQAAAWHSTDLESWKRTADGSLDNDERGSWRWMSDVAAGSLGYVAVGVIGDPDVAGQERPAVWMSQNGVDWDVHQPPLPSDATRGDLSRVAIKGSTVVALGVGQAAKGAFVFAVVSNDAGQTWQSIRLPNQRPAAALESSAVAVTPTPAGFAAVSTTGMPGASDVVLWTSADGTTWRATAPTGSGLSGRGNQRIHGLTMSGDRLLGVGTSANFESEHVTLWQTPLP